MHKSTSSTNSFSMKNSAPSTGKGSFEDRCNDGCHISDSHQFHYCLKMLKLLNTKSGLKLTSGSICRTVF